jgi:tetratricopeptide (TPR) repeat protein
VRERPGRLWPVLLGVWAAAVAIRCLYLWQIHDAVLFDLRIGDAQSYHLWARRIADGDWLGHGVFYQAPLYPYLLAVIYRLLGDGIGTVRVVQALLGGVSCALLAAAGVSLFGRRGAIAGVLLAIYPSAIFLDGLVEKSSLVTFLIAALLAVLAAARMSWRRSLAAGVILGLLALTRENALVLALPVLLWIGLGPFDVARLRLRTALVFVAGCALVLLPVALRNQAAGGEFHLTTSQFGPNFYIGNHAGADGTYQALVVGHGSAADEREDATRLAEQAAGRKLSPGEVSGYWTSQALDYIRSQPLAWLKLTARKLALTFNAAEIADTESQSIYAERSWLMRILGPFDFGLLFGMAVFGTVATAASWRRLWFLYALAMTYALSVALFYVFARYRFPIVPILMLLGTGGILQAVDGVRLRRMRPLVMAAAAGLAAIAVAQLPLDNPKAARATNYFDIAAALSKDPARTEDAREFYQRALDTDPQFPAAQFGLGTLLARAGRPEEAIPHYRSALAIWPDYAEARSNLGLALAATGHAEAAVAEYAAALGIRTDDADTRLALGKGLLTLNRPGQAMEQYEQVLASQPKNVQALVGWGVALAQSGRPQDAIAKYQLALEIDPNYAAAHNSLGTTLASQGRIAEAVPHFERAVELDPGDENAKRNLATAREMLSRH